MSIFIQLTRKTFAPNAPEQKIYIAVNRIASVTLQPHPRGDYSIISFGGPEYSDVGVIETPEAIMKACANAVLDDEQRRMSR